jgi:hypothetical protein
VLYTGTFLGSYLLLSYFLQLMLFDGFLSGNINSEVGINLTLVLV